MALRFLQIFIPDNVEVNVEELLGGREVLGTWRDASVKDRLVLHLLVPAEETEPIMDRFEDAYAHTEGFRVVLFPVEAVLPRPDEADGDAAVTEDRKKGSINGPGRVSREELYSDVIETLGISRVFVALTVLSSIVAAVGLLRNDVAIIIGAMMIAPLLGPNVAMSLSATLGDLKLLRRALLTNMVGVTLALMIAVMIGITLTVDPAVPSIASRTRFGVGDLALALAAGSAGAFAFTRGLSGTLIGVMVAVALMPPTVTFGMLLGGGHFTAALGGLLLLVGNVVCLNLAGVATFLAQGVRPRMWWEEERARKSTRIAIGAWILLLLTLCVIVYVTQMSGSVSP